MRIVRLKMPKKKIWKKTMSEAVYDVAVWFSIRYTFEYGSKIQRSEQTGLGQAVHVVNPYSALLFFPSNIMQANPRV